jgi:hypothetical protein
MVKRKGAFQLSLGFIVAVVFAVILLTLAITWVNQIMGQIGVLTDDLTQQASEKLKETFAETDQRFSIWPDEYALSRGHALKMLAGIINREPDSDRHEYSILVVSNNQKEEWIDDSAYINQRFSVQFNKILEIPITITPTPDAQSGTYTFWVYACIDLSTCTEDNYNYESPQHIRITLE